MVSTIKKVTLIQWIADLSSTRVKENRRMAPELGAEPETPDKTSMPFTKPRLHPLIEHQKSFQGLFNELGFLLA